MNINEECKYIVQDKEYDCVVLDKKEDFGPSIQNHLLQSMDLRFTIYYKINFDGNEIWVTENYLTRK